MRATPGSFTNSRIRVMVGRMFSDTAPASLIWGVTFMTSPTGTVLTVLRTSWVRSPDSASSSSLMSTLK